MRKRVIFVFLAVGGTFTACGTLLSEPYANEYRDFSKHAVAATGTVTDTESQNHDGVGYDYTVDGRRYHGAWPAGENGNPNADQLKPGDEIAIYYRSDNPADSCACNPWREAENPLPNWAIAGAGLGAFAAWVLSIVRPGGMRLESRTVGPIGRATPDDVQRVLRGLRPSDGFVILERRPGHFMQTAALDHGAFVLEYREGWGGQTQYRAPGMHSLPEVLDAFQSYLRQDGAWRTALEWKPFIDDRAAPGSAPSRCPGRLIRSLARAAVTTGWCVVQIGILATLVLLAGVTSAAIGLVLIPHFEGRPGTLGPLVPGVSAAVIVAFIVNHNARIWLQRARLRRWGSTAVSVMALVVWVDRSTSYSRGTPYRTAYTVHLRWQNPLGDSPHEYWRRYTFWYDRSTPFEDVFRPQAEVPVRYPPGHPSHFIIDVPFAPSMAEIIVGAD